MDHHARDLADVRERELLVLVVDLGADEVQLPHESGEAFRAQEELEVVDLVGPAGRKEGRSRFIDARDHRTNTVWIDDDDGESDAWIEVTYFSSRVMRRYLFVSLTEGFTRCEALQADLDQIHYFLSGVCVGVPGELLQEDAVDLVLECRVPRNETKTKVEV